MDLRYDFADRSQSDEVHNSVNLMTPRHEINRRRIDRAS